MNATINKKLSRVGLVVAFAAMMVLVLLSPVGWSQTDRASISGTVTDSTGAVVGGVKATVSNSLTGVRYPESTTNAAGIYRVLSLPVGTYSVVFKKDGFETYQQNGITLSVAQNAIVNVALQVGSVNQSIIVTSDAAALETTTATESTTVVGSVIEELPLSIAGGRNAMSFANMAVPTVGGGIVANSQSVSANIMVDGIDADSGIQGSQMPPGLDAVREIQVQTSGIDAASAQTGGGTFQYELKSGSNKFHGSAFGFLTNEALDANTWANNYWLGSCAASSSVSTLQCPSDYRTQYRRQSDRLKDWGVSGGGPLWKKHTFFFGDYERYDQNTMAWVPNAVTVPTTQMLTGDFSQLLTYSGIPSINPNCTAGVPCPTGAYDAGGNPVYYGAIFNPAEPGTVFPGNVIPSAQISAQAQQVIKIYQQDYAPTNTNLLNNYWGFNGDTNLVQNLDAKVDHTFSDKHHVSGSLDWAKSDETTLGNHNNGVLWQKGSSTGGPFADAWSAPYKFANIHLSDSYIVSSNLINNAIIAFNWSDKGDITPQPQGNDFNAKYQLFPNIFYGSTLGINQSAIGQDFNDNIRWQQIRLKDSASWVHGRHILNVGVEGISYNALGEFPGGITNYTFSSAVGLPQSLANNSSLAGYLGYGLANMMLGEAATASQGVTQGDHTTRKAFDIYGEDEIKVTSKLTADVSLRWDVNGPLHEKNGLWSNWNPALQNSSWPGLLGSWQYLSNSSQSFETDEDYHLFSPHAGVAYQLSHNLVVRGAWGLFYVPLGQNSWGGIPYATMASSCFECFGSNQTAPPASNIDADFNWDQSIYPGIYQAPEKNPNGNFGGWGMAVYLTPDQLKLAHTQNWNLGVEYGVDKYTVVDIRYTGNTGVNLHDGSLYPQNYPTWSKYQPLLMSGHAGDWISNQNAAVAAGVPWYPFLTQSVGGYGGYSGEESIAPFPQVASGGPLLVAGYPHGSSGFNALIAEVKKRSGGRLSMDLSYTLSRAVQNVSNYMNSTNGGNMTDGWETTSPFQDPYSYQQFKKLISPNDMRHQVKGYVSYNLPFGRNGLWLQGSRALDYVVGGWTVSGDLNYHSGQPMPAVHAANAYPGWSQTFANLSSDPHALSNHFKHLDLANLNDSSNQFFSPSAFTDQTLNTTNALYGTLGNQLPYNSQWRQWAYYNEDGAVVKHFGFAGDSRFKLSVRAEFFDLLNRHHWNTPNNYSVTEAYFGQVTGVYGNRTGQAGVRLEW